MSEQSYLTMKEEFSNALSGDALKNALDYIDCIKENGFTLDGVWNRGYVFHYRGKCVCLVALPPFWDVTGWNIYGFDCNTMYDDLPVAESLKEFAWAHVKPCAVAIGGDCGGDCKPGIRAQVLGKDFDGTCCHVTKFENPNAGAVEKIIELTQVWKHCIDVNADVFAKIEEETGTYLKGDNLRIAMDLLVYLKESGRTWIMSEYHPEFYYMGELTCLIAYAKTDYDEATLAKIRQQIEEAGNRYVYYPSSSWNLCCWQHDDDIYELDSFPVDEGLKDFARENVWKCIRCDGCSAPGGGRRTVFGKEFDNACCNVFQFANPDDEMLVYIKKLMELEKHIIADAKKK